MGRRRFGTAASGKDGIAAGVNRENPRERIRAVAKVNAYATSEGVSVGKPGSIGPELLTAPSDIAAVQRGPEFERVGVVRPFAIKLLPWRERIGLAYSVKPR